ncbi:MAG: ABC transporter ATP-binding protein [Pirellulaceae bacterium]|nr:ABC transporter ATP-binding protein [Pirellulaceae bacterium]
MTTSLSATDLCKSYPLPAGELSILKGANLRLSSGENCAIVGPSGSGKSTLLHLLGGLDEPTSGEVLLDSVDIYSLSEREKGDFRGREIGFIFQEHHLLPQLNVLENVLVPLLATEKNASSSTDRAKTLLDRVGLGDRLAHRPAELSGGERERVAVARALIRSPKLLLADEPTGNLDPKNASMVGELLLSLQKEEKAILVVVTHNLSLAKELDAVYRLDEGQLTKQATSV